MKKEPTIEFEINGVSFRGRTLSPEAALDAFSILSPALSTVLDEINPQMLREGVSEKEKQAELGRLLGRALGSFKDLPKMRPFFFPVYEAEISSNGQTTYCPLKDSKFEEKIFGGKAMLTVAFLVAAIGREYGDFLRENGLGIFKDLAALFGLQLRSKSTGQSGG